MHVEEKLSTTRLDPDTEKILTRGVRKVSFSYKGRTAIVDMPGWYPADGDEGIHTREDCKASDRALNRLKAEVDKLLLPEEIQTARGSERNVQPW